MRTTSHIGISGLILVALLALVAPPASAATTHQTAHAVTQTLAEKKKVKKKKRLTLKASHTRAAVGARVTLKVANSTGVRRSVRIQRWDAHRRVWRTVTVRTVGGSRSVGVRVAAGTSKYRATAAKTRKRSKGKMRTFRAAQSTVVAVTGHTAPAAAPATPKPPVPRQGGSVPVGTATYPIPSSAIFVAPLGTSGGSGTLSDPYGSIATALARAKAGSTLVLRGGLYHERVLIDIYKTGLVIQNYPGEAAWLDGTKRVTNWAPRGSRWAASGWNHIFDHRIMSGTSDQTSRYVDPSRPMASYPDQVWLNGRELTQVASEAAVRSGTFYIDPSAKRIVLGDNPSGKVVEASYLQQAMEIHAANVLLRGIGVRRYATTGPQFAAIIAGGTGITMENVVVSNNTWVGIVAWKSGQTYRNVTIANNGIIGFGGNKSNDLLIEGSLISGNNASGYKSAPIASGLKITSASRVVLRNNAIVDTAYAGAVWFDVSSSYLKIIGNTIENNAAGLMIELSENALVADNHVLGNGGTGIRIHSSGSVDVWNNTVVGNARPFAVWSDERRQEDPALVATIPWVVDDIDVHNNVLAMTGADPCPILTQDGAQVLSGNDFGITSDNNLFARPGPANPANLVCWANGKYQLKSFKNLEQFRAGTGNDLASTLVEGRAVVDARAALTPESRTLAETVAAPLPVDIADAIGQPEGSRGLGAYSGRR